MSEVLEIDGSVLEGGGQILRMSIALSAILGIPVKVMNIRAGRSKPGLAAQHLKGIQLVAEMCQAKLKGGEIGSTEIQFIPGKIRGGQYTADTKTAGSISLLLQVALPCALLADAPVTLELMGGTNADMAPQIDYMGKVFSPALNKFGASFDLGIIRRGYYPRGGGHVRAAMSPVRGFRAVTLTDRGAPGAVTGWSFVAGMLPMKLAFQMARGAKQELGLAGDVDIKCYKESREVARDNSAGIILLCRTSTGCVVGADGLGRRGLDPLAVGRKAGGDLARELRSGACLDSYAQDQVIIYMALAEGKSTVKVGEVTLHTKTAIHVAELIGKVRFNIMEDGDQYLIECTGLGFINKSLPT